MLYGAGKYRFELIDGWAKSPEGWSFHDVTSLCIDGQDRLYVFCRGAHPVIVFDRQGNMLHSWGEGVFRRPHSIAIGPDGSVYCVDDLNDTLSKFSPDGRLLLRLGGTDRPAASAEPRFSSLTGVALSSSGDIYLGDGNNARVHKFAADGTHLLSWGKRGTGAGEFDFPHSIRVDRRENVWVGDRENNRIQIFSPNGKFLTQWIGIPRPNDMAIDRDEVVFVAEHGQQVSAFARDGGRLTAWGSLGEDRQTGLFHTPHAIAIDSRGDIYVGEIRHEMASRDRGTRALQKFARAA